MIELSCLTKEDFAGHMKFRYFVYFRKNPKKILKDPTILTKNENPKSLHKNLKIAKIALEIFDLKYT